MGESFCFDMGTYDQSVKFTPPFKSEVSGIPVIHNNLLLPSTPGPGFKMTKMIAFIKLLFLEEPISLSECTAKETSFREKV